jgi:hypothetical protein
MTARKMMVRKPAKPKGKNKGENKTAPVSGKTAITAGGIPDEIAELARRHAADAVAALLAVMNNAKASPAARISAARTILEWGFQDPAEAKSGSGKNGDLPQRLVRLRWAGKQLPQHGNDGHKKERNEQMAEGARIRVVEHASDCAMHNAPAYKAGACDCGAVRD